MLWELQESLLLLRDSLLIVRTHYWSSGSHGRNPKQQQGNCCVQGRRTWRLTWRPTRACHPHWCAHCATSPSPSGLTSQSISRHILPHWRYGGRDRLVTAEVYAIAYYWNSPLRDRSLAVQIRSTLFYSSDLHYWWSRPLRDRIIAVQIRSTLFCSLNICYWWNSPLRDRIVAVQIRSTLFYSSDQIYTILQFRSDLHYSTVQIRSTLFDSSDQIYTIRQFRSDLHYSTVQIYAVVLVTCYCCFLN